MKCWNTPPPALSWLGKKILTPCWLEKWKIAQRSRRWGMHKMARESWTANRWKKKKKHFLCSAAYEGIWLTEKKTRASGRNQLSLLMVISVLRLLMSKHFHGLLRLKHVVGVLKSLRLRWVVRFTSAFFSSWAINSNIHLIRSGMFPQSMVFPDLIGFASRHSDLYVLLQNV